MTIGLSIMLIALVLFPFAIHLTRDKSLDNQPARLPEMTPRIAQELRALD